MPEPHRFGRYELRPVERVLFVDGRPATLGTRAFDLLLTLIERRQGVVSKDELLKLVWPGAQAAESNLHMQISAIRGLLGAQAIATVPGRGYQFTLRLDSVDGTDREPAPNGADRPLPAATASTSNALSAAPPAPASAAAAPASAAVALAALPPEPSSTLPSTRKLAAILSSDVVGYSRLMGQDDRATLEAIVATRSVMAGHITRHGGRVVDASGDALLGEFASAVESVRCAVAIQAELDERNAQLPQTRRMVLRIGLNVGDVIEQNAALYGEGVNVAARLQALGEPGGVCISGSIFDQVEGRLPLVFRSAGEQAVKNIAKPVRAYHVGAAPAGASPAQTATQTPSKPTGRPQPVEYRFSGAAQFELRPDQRLLLADAQPAKLGARAFDVLLALIEHRERLVSKNELLDIVWPGVVVEEGNLQTQVSNLRKLLGPQVIETIPGRGYRFMAALLSRPDEPVAAELPAPAQAAAEAAAAPAAVATRAAAAPAKPEFKTNLPETLPVLFGREDDVAALGALIEQHRLISIIAAGGMGKTRLALQLLHERRQAYEHGVCWVELSALTDPQLVVSTIASALGIQTGTGDALQGLLASLKGLTLLVALDNAEHLIDEVARVVQLLVDGAPNLHLLVTSQVPLKCAKERVYRLGPLAVPDTPVSADEAKSFGAVALFVDCAQAAQRQFELTEHNVATVIDICHHLDGLALAIELAAARVPLLGLTKLAASLSERLRVLTGGTRTAPQRQKTLRAALEWSHALLSPAEQTVFRRLGVFAGGFNLEMAQSVVADDTSEHPSEPPLDEWAVLDTLGALVDRSLVMADAGERPRYRLLESPRAFALERLAAAKEESEWKRRHAHAVLAHFLAIEADCWAGRIGVDAAIAVLEPDLDNGREAMAWALKHDARTAVALAAPLAFALTYERREELLEMWQATTKQLTDDLPDTLRAVWATACAIFWLGEKPALSSKWARVALDHHRRSNDRIGMYLALGLLAIGDSLQAKESAHAAFAEMCKVEDKAWPARVKFFAAYAGSTVNRTPNGSLAASTSAMQGWCKFADQAGDSWQKLNGFVSLADNELAAGRPDEAVRLGMALVRQLQSSRHLSVLGAVQLNLIAALLACGSLAEARKMAEQALPLAKQFGRLDWVADNIALLAALEGRVRIAAKLLGFGDAIYAANGQVRQFNEARAVEQAERIAREQLGDSEFERLRSRGATMQEDDIAKLALGVMDS